MAPQKCYMDHIESWSTNECTINWNAPIAWIATYLSANGNSEGGSTTTSTLTSDTPTNTPTATPTKATSTPKVTAKVTTTSKTTPTKTTATPKTSTPIATESDTNDSNTTDSTNVTLQNNSPVKVNYAISNDWGNGADVAITLNNTSSKAINGWLLSFTFTDNQVVTNSWGTKYFQSGNTVIITGENWTSTIPANSSLSFGINISHNGPNSMPINFTIR